MKIRVTRHFSYFLLPAVMIQPAAWLGPSRMAWTITLWWGSRGLMVIGPGDEVHE